MALNEIAHELANLLAADAANLGIAVHKLPCGTRIIDCGVEVAGSIQAGRRLAEICMAGHCNIYLTPSDRGEPTALNVCVATPDPVAACMASQYAGWEIKAEKFFAMGSGPMRAAAGREALFDTIGHREKPDVCVGVLETARLPPDGVCEDIAVKCGVAPDRLTLLTARTASHAGNVQIVARSIETALHKLHQLHFDLERIISGSGIAPLPPVAGDDMTAIGWTNDAILYGATVTLEIRGDLKDLGEIGPRVPSCASPDYGRPFAEIFARYDHDFYRIDPMLFSPALIGFTSTESSEPGPVFGRLAPEVLSASFGADYRYKK